MDTANILLVEWANGCEVICNTIKARLMVKEVVVSQASNIALTPLPIKHSDHARDGYTMATEHQISGHVTMDPSALHLGSSLSALCVYLMGRLCCADACPVGP